MQRRGIQQVSALFLVLVTSGISWSSENVDLFEKRIRPVLIEHCYRCHSADTKRLKGGLLLDRRDGLLRGGDSGPAIVPGKPEESLLIQALRYEDDLEMPPKGKLPDSVIADFVRWVALGAPDPRVADPRAADAKPAVEKLSTGPARSWAFAPPAASAPPEVRDVSWPRGEVDRFILARLEAAGLRPGGDADRWTLIRRLHFGLIGLPPTREEIASFVSDESPRALEGLVDRLLDSPRFGERWGRHWLDLARYSDSTGGGRTKALENAWRYRDYVVASFNEDRPFDRFIREQIAGDLLPAADDEARRRNLIATGFLVLGPHNYENQDKDLLRMDVVDEQIDTTGRVFLGLTLGCARCHDHKFDPIPTEDYYALAGIFRSTKTLTPGNVAGFVERPLPVAGELKEKLAGHEGQVAALEKRLAEVAALIPKESGKASASAKELGGIVVDDTAARKIGTWKASTSVARYVGKGYTHDENVEKGRKSVLFSAELPASGEYEVRLAYSTGTNRATNTPVLVEFAGGRKTVRVNQRRAPTIDRLLVSLGRYPFEKAEPAKVTIQTADTDGVVIADAVQFVPAALVDRPAKDGKDRDANGIQEKVAAAKPDAERIEKARAEQKELTARLNKLRATGPKQPMAISVVDEAEPADWHLHVRGEIRNLGPKVARGFLSAASERRSTPPAIPGGESGRRELADWIADDEHPLTARVIVNRVWHWLFGAGLLRTVDNFGRMGEAPSHPELLDALAVEFVRDGWSIKRLVRRIVLSRTYGLHRDPPPGAAAIDPGNRLLSHAPRRRLEADEMRDTILFVSGELDLRAGGPSIDVAVGKMAGNKVEYGYRFSTRRRSIYVPIFRNSLLEILDVFDFADPNLVVGRRTNTTRATQALYLLNSPFVIDHSARAAARLLAERGLSDSERVEVAYERILGRAPTRREHELAVAFVAGGDAAGGDAAAGAGSTAAPGAEREERWTGLVQILFSCVDFRFLR